MVFQGLSQSLLGRVDLISVRTTVLGFSIVFLFWAVCNYKKNAKLPPGPFPMPIIGNLHQLGKLPHRALYELSKKYGPIMHLRLGSIPLVVVSSSEMAKEFLKTHDLAFSSRPASVVGELLAYNYRNVGMAPSGAYWRYMKKMMVTELLSAQRLKTFQSIREEEVAQAMRSIWETSKGGTIQLNVIECTYNTSLAIIWRTLTGSKINDDLGKDVRGLMREVAAAIFNVGDFIPWIGWMDLQGLMPRMKEVHNYFDGLMEKIIDEHSKFNGNDTKQAKDIVDVLLEVVEMQKTEMEVTRDDCKAVTLDLLIGGVDTTSITLEWAMSALIRYPTVAKKLQEEIESVVGNNRMVKESDLDQMEYLKCVIKETLRLYLPGPLLLPHESTETCTVGPQGFVIPPKTRVFINAWAIARDPAVWADPLEFMPERFMGKSIDITKGQEFGMVPFGAGRRRCPAATMAMGHMALILGNLMHCFHWRVEGNPLELDMSESFGISMPRKHNLFAFPSLKLRITL